MSEPSQKSRNALVVDDSLDSAVPLAMMLENLGWKTEIAKDGIEALKLANQSRPALILLDISMPKLDGYDTCGVIRAQPWASEIKMFAVTGLSVESVKDRLKASGFDGWLIKPVEFAEVSAVATLA